MAAAPPLSLRASFLHALGAADAVRRVCLAQLVRSPAMRSLFLRRDRRVAATLMLHAIVAWVGAIFCPVLLLIAGPVLVGIPHLAADIRHLIVRRRWPPRLQVVAWGAFALLAAVPATGVDDRVVTRVSVGVPLGATMLGMALLRFPGAHRPTKGPARPSRRLALVLTGLCVFAAMGVADPDRLRLVLVHAHNLVPWLVVAILAPAARRTLLYPAAFVAVAALFLVMGLGASLTLASPLAAALPSHVLVWAESLAPGLTVARAVGWTSAFAFLQSSHYALWLVAIPELDRPRSGATTLRTRARLYLGDCGMAGTGLVVLGSLALLGLACATSWSRATHTYLAWAGFHAYAELALLGLWLVRAAGPPAAAMAPRT